MRIERLTKPALPLPTVVDCTDRADELPRLILLGAHAHGVGWRHIVRLWFRERIAGGPRPARTAMVVDVGGRDQQARHRALAETFAGGGVTKIEVYERHRLGGDGVEE
jgi:hypothetical protein